MDGEKSICIFLTRMPRISEFREFSLIFSAFTPNQHVIRTEVVDR